MIELSSGVTCVGSSFSSTVQTRLLYRSSVPLRVEGALKRDAGTELGRVIRGVVAGDVKGSSVYVSGRSTRTVRSLHGFVFTGLCGGPITGDRRGGTGTVLGRLCFCCVRRVRRLPRGCLTVLKRNSSGKHVVYSCVSNVASRCTAAGFRRCFMPMT